MANTEKSYQAEFDTEAEAQALADKIHEQMIDPKSKHYSPSYAKSVEAGKTLRWAIPRRARVPVNAKDPMGPTVEVGGWKVSVPDFKTRSAIECLSANEIEKLDQAGKDVLAARQAKPR